MAFVAQLTVSTSANYLIADDKAVAHFAVSYDVWVEHFSVTKITDHSEQGEFPSRTSRRLPPRRGASRISRSAASELPADKPFYVQTPVFRVEDPRDPGSVHRSLWNRHAGAPTCWKFSNPTTVRDKQAHWLLKGGPIASGRSARRRGCTGEASVTLRTRLALVFIAATLVPLGPTIWLTTNLFDRSWRP